MAPRHTLARAVGIACAAATLCIGCFGSHAAGGPGEPRVDGGTAPAADADAPPRLDAAPTPIPEPAPRCGRSDGLSFDIERIGTEACEPGRYEGVMLYEIEPASDGVRLLIDTCPDADADCRCAVTVTGVDEGLAEEVDTSPDSGPMVAVLADDGVLIESVRDCPMEDASCVRKLIFAAMDGSLESPPIDPGALDLAWGESVCSGEAPELGPECSIRSYELVVTAWVDGFPGPIGFEERVVEGSVTLLDDAGTIFHAVRANASSCPDARFARTAAWLAWDAR